jgi:hypothetical protein
MEMGRKYEVVKISDSIEIKIVDRSKLDNETKEKIITNLFTRVKIYSQYKELIEQLKKNQEENELEMKKFAYFLGIRGVREKEGPAYSFHLDEDEYGVKALEEILGKERAKEVIKQEGKITIYYPLSKKKEIEEKIAQILKDIPEVRMEKPGTHSTVDKEKLKEIEKKNPELPIWKAVKFQIIQWK